MVANNYVSIFVLYFMFMYYGIFGSYSQYYILASLKENIIFIYKIQQDNIVRNYIIIYGGFQ